MNKPVSPSYCVTAVSYEFLKKPEVVEDCIHLYSWILRQSTILSQTAVCTIHQ